MKIASLILSLSFLVYSPITRAQQAKPHFTVADDVGLTLFNVQGGGSPEMHFSPNGKYFAVWAERGRLDLNGVEDSLRFYRTQDVEAFFKDGNSQSPGPLWIVTQSGKRNPVIDKWRWLGDSSGVAFLKPGPDGVDLSQQLVLADLRKKIVEPLISSAEEIQAFDVRDRQHYVYVLTKHPKWETRRHLESQASAVVGTDRSLLDLLFPDSPLTRRWLSPSTTELWAVIDGERFEVKHNGVTPPFEKLDMSLSPDGRSLATLAPVDDVPPSWEALYPPPQFLSYMGGTYRPQHSIKPGRGTAKQYVRIDLKSGSVKSFIDSPSMDSVGIIRAEIPPVWSPDGQAILLPGVFLKPEHDEPVQPCIAIVDLQSNKGSCVAVPKEGYREIKTPVDNYHRHVDIVVGARFAPADSRRILISFDSNDGTAGRTEQYQLSLDGSWKFSGEIIGAIGIGPDNLQIKVTQSFSEPPLLVAAKKEKSRVLWDPNPQLKEFELAQVSVYKWKDSQGRNWEGALYKPTNYKQGQHYPLVIQTHGFTKSQFLASGLYSTAFAAQELAAAGIMVLQTEYGEQSCEMDTSNEAPCNVGVIESAAKQIVSDGLADPQRIGIIGFSRTCYYVMEMLTTNPIHLQAAAITDGVLIDYFSCMFFGSCDGETKIIGAEPFGDGLQQWLKRSPEFKLDQVTTPLLVNTVVGGAGAISMWAPYIGLRNLKKPVDLMIFDGSEHIATNPAIRMGSQGGTVDWFRFWLQGYEDPDAAKAEQYKRWRGLREMQSDNEKSNGKPPTPN